MTVGSGADCDDEALLEALAGGDRAALRALYERHAPWLSLRLVRRCGDPGLAEEVVQETFVAVWRKPEGYSGRGEVAAWLWGIAVRRLIDRLRRRPIASHLIPARADPAPSAEELVLEGVEYGDLAGALNRLAPELRAVLQARVLDGLSTREAARLLGIPQGTVKSRLALARRELRRGLV